MRCSPFLPVWLTDRANQVKLTRTPKSSLHTSYDEGTIMNTFPGRSDTTLGIVSNNESNEVLEWNKASADAIIQKLWAERNIPSVRQTLREYWLTERTQDSIETLLSESTVDRWQQKLDEITLLQLNRRHLDAFRICELEIANRQYDAVLLNHLGRTAFNIGKKQVALQAITQATLTDPNYAHAWNSLGHVHRDLGNTKDAQRAFSKAISLNGALSEAFNNLGTTYLALTQPNIALYAFRCALELNPKHIDALLNSGSSLHILRDYDDAQEMYQRAIEFTPSPLAEAHRRLAKLFNETGRSDEAERSFRVALDQSPMNPSLWAEYISSLELSNKLEPANSALSFAIQRFPDDPSILLESAKLHRRRGDIESAIRILRSITTSSLPPHIQQWYFHELGTSLDRANLWEPAFNAFLESNKIASQGTRSRLTDHSAFDRALTSMEKWVGENAPAPLYTDEDVDLGDNLCFLLGFPRSGTTLLDVMLDAHGSIDTLEEKQTIEYLLHITDAMRGGFPNGLSITSAKERNQLRSVFREKVNAHLPNYSNEKMLIDKMPIRTPYVAFIHRLFPNARFIFALRHPCDVVLSNFMQMYAANEVFVHFYTLESSATTYAKVMKLWDATESVVPSRLIHYVRYESLISDPSGTMQSVCAFLGVEWQEEITDHLQSVKNRKRIRTNSYHQVSEPVYTRSLNRWEQYSTHFEAALPQLQPFIEKFGYKLS